MKNYLTLCLLCCMAFVASSYSVSKPTETKINPNSKGYEFLYEYSCGDL